MATTVKVKFRASSIGTREGTIYYQVIHARVARQVRSDYKLYSWEWDADHAKVILSPDIEKKRSRYLISMKASLISDLARFKEIIAQLEDTGRPYTTDKVVELYTSLMDCRGFVTYARKLIGDLGQIGKSRTAERYATVLNSFVRFHGAYDLQFGEVNSKLMVEYETYLKENGVCPNSTSFYMRNLRAIYNRAVEESLTGQHNPFKYVYTGVDKTVKRAVPLKVIRRIRDADLTLEPTMDYARDLFMFSFYTRGMSFVDMAYLKKRDLQNGILSYRRQKTGQQLFVKWEEPMRKIADKYDTSRTPYLLPIIKDTEDDTYRQYKNASHLVNDKLKKLGDRLGLCIPLTTYVARHAWASIARSKNIPLSTISEAMGHDSEQTTRIYLASLDTSVVDKANSLILKSL